MNDKYVFSPSRNIFFSTAYKDTYIASGMWPDDGVPVSEKMFDEYTGIPPVGKVRVVIDGFPGWNDTPPLTQAELVLSANTELRCRIDSANEYMNSKQWPGKAALGRMKGDELAQYNLWLDYLDALEAVVTSNAPDINWPAKPE